MRTFRILWALILASVVFTGFALYAFLAPTTFEAFTEVRLDVSKDQENFLHPIADRRQRLFAAITSPEALKQLTKDLGSTPDARLELARHVAEDVSVATEDGRVFRIACRNPAAARAHELCLALSKVAVATLPEAALRRQGAAEGEQKKKVEQLLAFLAQHPELSSATSQPATGTASSPAASDALLNTLMHQRRVVMAEIQDLQKVDPNNPYAGDLADDISRAQKQLQGIDAAINTRRQGLAHAQENATKENAAPADGSALDKGVLTRLTEQLNKLAEESKTPALVPGRAVVATPAALPSSPIIPDRTRLLILGALAALGVGIIGVGFAVAAQPVSQQPQRQPQPTGSAMGSTAPLAPAADPYGATAAYVPHQGSAPPPAYVSTPQYANEPQYANGTPHYGNEEAMAAAAWARPQPDDVAPPRESPIPAPHPLQTTQVMDDPPHRAPAAVPRTQLGGFESAAPAPQAAPPVYDAPNASGGPISVKNLITVEAAVVDDGDWEREEPPRTLVGNPMADNPPVEPEDPAPRPQDNAPAKKAYNPPKRNITRRLGSLSWVDQAELSRGSTQTPVSTRYSYVSSRPPPPDGSNEVERPAEHAYESEVIEAHAEPIGANTPGLILAAPQVPLVEVRRHPVPYNWTVDPDLLKPVMQPLADSVLGQKRTSCCVIGVTARTELTQIKSRVAASLAFTLGQSEQLRVLLMEGDFQSPMVHRKARVEMPMSGGFSQQLQKRLIPSNPRSDVWEVVECTKSVHVLAEGFIRSPGAILSQEFERCLRAVRNVYDVIIIDGPSLSGSSESRALADVVDGAVVCTPREGTDVDAFAANLFGEAGFVIIWTHAA